MVDDDGRTTDHGHPTRSPCEPNGSGELKMLSKMKSKHKFGVNIPNLELTKTL